MKLGKETGSLINHLMSKSNDNFPTNENKDKGATVLHWTDRSAYFVNEVGKSGKVAVIERAKAIRSDNNGMSDSQSYTFERNENTQEIVVRFRYGRWWEEHNNDGKKHYSPINIKFGMMSEYYDYSF